MRCQAPKVVKRKEQKKRTEEGKKRENWFPLCPCLLLQFIITIRQVTFVCIDKSKAPKVSERQSTILSKFTWKEARNNQTSNLGDYELGLLSKTRTDSGRTLQTFLLQTRTWSYSMSIPLPLTSNHKSQQWLGSSQKSSSKAWPPPPLRPSDSPLASWPKRKKVKSSPPAFWIICYNYSVSHDLSCVNILLMLFYRVNKLTSFSKRRYVLFIITKAAAAFLYFANIANYDSWWACAQS